MNQFREKLTYFFKLWFISWIFSFYQKQPSSIKKCAISNKHINLFLTWHGVQSVNSTHQQNFPTAKHDELFIVPIRFWLHQHKKHSNAHEYSDWKITQLFTSMYCRKVFSLYHISLQYLCSSIFNMHAHYSFQNSKTSNKWWFFYDLLIS